MNAPPDRSTLFRTLLSIAVIGVFVWMLVGTSQPPTSAAPAPPATAPATPAPVAPPGPPPAPAAAVPDATSWDEVRIEAAGVSVRIPPGAEVDPAQAGHDPSFAGRYFRVKMPSGYEVYFAERSSLEPVSVVAQRDFYATRARGFRGYALDVADAVVANREEAPPVGTYCETTVCARAAPLCAHSAGATQDAEGGVTKMTAEECLQVVAIARSLKPLS